jgi:ribose transport system permease protein
MRSVFAANRSIFLAYGALILLVAVTSFFSPGFLSESSLRSTVILAAFVGIAALGQSFVIFGAGIDLSIPWVLNAAAIIVTFCCRGQNGALIWAVPLVLAAGALVGLINGVGIAILRVPAIIMTLASNIIIQGLVLVLSGGSPPPSTPSLVQFFAVGRIGPVPVIALIWALLTVIATVLLSKTPFGRHLYAVGTNADVSVHSGVPVQRTSILTYVISGLTAALTGILLTGYSRQAYLGMGDSYLFTSVAAVALGGASILGGSGNYLGTVAGALLLTVLSGLLPALNLSSGALLIVYGVIIIVTVSISSDAISGLFAMFAPRRPRGEPNHAQNQPGG